MRTVELSVDGQGVSVPEGSTLLDAANKMGVETPTLCYLETLTPVNVCRICVVEVEGARALVPACSRPAEPGMVVFTDSERVRTSRRMVLELLGASVDLSQTEGVSDWADRYQPNWERWGSPPAQEPLLDNPLYIRDYRKCILCYKCVEACGVDAQWTFAIAVAGRGDHAHISTEYQRELPDSACVFCGNCVAVCPTGALQGRAEWELRQAGEWEEEQQTVTSTICSYCGVGCVLDLHVQSDRVVKVTSPLDNQVTSGSLCIKGRFGYEYLHDLDEEHQGRLDQLLNRG